MQPGILVLDDLPDGESCKREIASLGYRPIGVRNLQAACDALRSESPAGLLSDIRCLTDGAEDLLELAQHLRPKVPVVVLSGIDTIDAAAEWLRWGALFYLLKPVSTPQLKLALEKVVALRSKNGESPDNLSLEQDRDGLGKVIVGASEALRNVLSVAIKAAESDANIVLLGESGTGKELLAQTIHGCSSRSKGEFVPVDCASLPDNLLEAELFGFEKGAFTGAIHAKPGLMELANGGTLFFDEIAELSPTLQPKLLRALQERRHRRLGGTKMVDFDVRVIAATNRDLGELVSAGKFRRDLFYRLNVVPLRLPPLRERENDITLLANHKLFEFGRKNRSSPKHFAQQVLGLFQKYSWPGNVRELFNVVEYCCALSRADTIDVADLPKELVPYDPKVVEAAVLSTPLTLRAARKQWLTQVESEYVADLMKRHGDNVSQAARTAQVDRKTLYSLLEKHHIPIFAERASRRRRSRPQGNGLTNN